MCFGEKVKPSKLVAHQLIDSIVDSYDLILPEGYKRRDPKEPGRAMKEAWEVELFKIFRLRFDAQADMIRTWLEDNRLKNSGVNIPIDHPESDELLVQAFAGMMDDGLQQFSLANDIVLDYAAYNEDALFWVDSWVTDLTEMIDKTTGKRLERELTSFISEEGYTIGDVIDGLMASGLDSGRAEDIAVSEITRTFGKSEFAAGQQALAEFPDAKVIKTWYTNNDSMVCEICAPLNELTVLINDQFVGEFDHPPAHKSCRCWMQSRTDIADTVALGKPEIEVPGFDTVGGSDD